MSKTMSLMFALCVLACVSAQAAVYTIPLDQQINLGGGNAITPDDQTPAGVDKLTFENEGGVGFARLHLVADNGMGGYYGGPNIGLALAGIGAVNLSIPGSIVEFDARYYQDPVTNTDPYHDAPVFLEIDNGSDFVGTQGFYWQSYQWQHISVDFGTYTNWYTGNPTMDKSQIVALNFWGTDWAGNGDDYVDFKNLKITAVPEPSSLLALLGGIGTLGGALIRRRM